MADKKISQLTTLSELSGDEQIPVAKDGANYKISAGDLMTGNVRYDAAQDLTVEQKEQLSENEVVPTVFIDESEINKTLSDEKIEKITGATQILYNANNKSYIYTLGKNSSNSICFLCFYNDVQLNALIYVYATKSLINQTWGFVDSNAVNYKYVQHLTTEYQTLARTNISAMAATPSGDPMHYMYEEAGAVYDAATNKWSFSQTISNVGTFTVDNLSTEDVRYSYMNTYAQCRNTNMQSSCNYLNIKFAFSKQQQLGGFMSTSLSMNFAFSSCQFLKQFIGYNYFPDAALYAFRGCRALKSVSLNATNLKQVTNMFQNCDVLSDFYLNRLNTSISLVDSPLVSPASLAWTINNTQDASSTYSITLHHDAYVAAMADTAVIAALESHTGVTLIDAGETETE